jgi:hypothetical protein
MSYYPYGLFTKLIGFLFFYEKGIANINSERMVFMTETMDCRQILEQLREPFPAEDIEWRVQRTYQRNGKWHAVVLAYVTSRAIMNRLDEVFLTHWKNEFLPWENDRGVKCRIWFKVGEEWYYREDGASLENNKEHIDPIKSAFSNALKRAAVQLGIGRYLYNLEEVHVELKERGQHYQKVQEGNQTRYLYWDTPSLPSWALPNRREKHQQSPNNQKRDQLVMEIHTMRNRVGLANDGWFVGLYKTVNELPTVGFQSVDELYEKATMESLEKVYRVMKPVAAVVAAGANYNVGEARLLELCQIVTGQEIQGIANALLKVRDEHAPQIIELCKAEQAQQQRQSRRRGA